MAATLIEGISGVMTVTINALDYKAVLGAWRCRAQKQFFPATVFAGAGWANEFSGLKQLVGVTTGFLSHGVNISDPLLNFATSAGVPIVLQADTGSTITIPFAHIEIDAGVTAAAASEFGVTFRSKTPDNLTAPSSTWNTST